MTSSGPIPLFFPFFPGGGVDCGREWGVDDETWAGVASAGVPRRGSSSSSSAWCAGWCAGITAGAFVGDKVARCPVVIGPPGESAFSGGEPLAPMSGHFKVVERDL